MASANCGNIRFGDTFNDSENNTAKHCPRNAADTAKNRGDKGFNAGRALRWLQRLVLADEQSPATAAKAEPMAKVMELSG